MRTIQQKTTRKKNRIGGSNPEDKITGKIVRDKKSFRGRVRQLRCDCGKLAVTVITVQVGSDPQYTIHIPLCSDCLDVERGMQVGY